MIEEIINSYQKIYKNPKLSNSIDQRNNNNYLKKYIDFDKDTELIISQITPDSSFLIPQKNLQENSKNQNSSIPKKLQKKHEHQHSNCSSCPYCHPYFRMLKKQRKKLVNFINNNKSRNIKLIGNDRYSHISPIKYVHDSNRKLSGRKMGIIPIPIKKKKKNFSKVESVDLHELQRSIVMMRRIQYDRKIRKGRIYNFLDDVIFIQRWWRRIKKEIKIKKIQRSVRDLIRKKRIKFIKQLNENFDKIKKKINKIYFRKCLSKIKKYRHIQKPIINSDLTRNKSKITNNYYYMSREINILSSSFINKINDIQNNYRVHKAILKKNKLLRSKKAKPTNKKQYLFTKIIVNENYLNNIITMLQRNIRNFLHENKKNKIIKINKKRESLGLYINKLNVNTYILKIIKFNKKLRLAMQIIAFKKKEKKTKYKNYKDYNINDINEISKIQKQYKIHYNKYNINKKELIKIYSNKSTLNCYISKLRKQKNDKIVLLMQKALKSTLKRIRFEKNIIKNKPKSIDFTNFNNSKNNDKNLGITNTNNIKYIQSNNGFKKNNQNNLIESKQNFSIDDVKDSNLLNNKYEVSYNKNFNILKSKDFNKNQINYNLVTCITKKRIINVNKKLILLERKIKSFLFVKKTKNDYYNNKNCLFINKININRVFYVSKNQTNEKDCIEKIVKIQKYYKSRFKYFKNNIIKFTISTDREEELIKFQQKIKRNINLFGNNNIFNNSSKYNNNLEGQKQNDIDISKNKNNFNINTIETDSFAIENKLNENKNAIPTQRLNSFQTQRNKFLLLSYLVERNRKPIQQIIGNYYEKIRVDSKVYEQFVNKRNIYFIKLNQLNRGFYITKKRYKNYFSQIKLIQKNFRIKQNKKIFKKEPTSFLKKPLIQNYIICDDKINEVNKERENNDPNSELEEDSYFESVDRDFGDLVGEKVYTIYNKNRIIRQPHLFMNNYYYISKEFRYKEKEEFSSQKEYESIKKDLKQRRLKNKDISQKNQNNPKVISFVNVKNPNQKIEDSSTNNKIQLKNIKIENQKKKDKINSNINTDNKSKYSLNKSKKTDNIPKMHNIKTNICYIDKIRIKNNKILKLIKKEITKKKKEKENNEKIQIDINKTKNIKYIINVSYLKPLNDICFISKNIKNKEYRHRELITSKQNSKNIKNNNFILNDLKINNSLQKMKIIDKNNLINNNINSNNSFNNSLNNNNNYLNIYNNQKSIKNDSNSYSSEKISNGNNMISVDSKNSKNNIKKSFNSININKKINYFHNKINYINFIQLINLFIIKNIQQYFFYKILHYTQINYNILTNKIMNLYNNTHFIFPFYIESLNRIFKYITKEKIQNKRIKKFLNYIFPSINKNKSFYYLLICLSFENKKKLLNTNLYNSKTEKNIMIQFLDDFSKFDKNVSQKDFITDKINKTKFNNTNIFTLVKFIDVEYDKLNKNIYCQNCYQLQKLCCCFNQKYINNYFSNTSGEYILERDLNEDTGLKSGKIMINYFVDENDKDEIKRSYNNKESIYIKKKPKSNNKDNNSLLFIYNY